MAGRFPLYTDADVRGPIVRALIRDGWDVLRAIDAFPERTRDPIHFEAAARANRVLVANDTDHLSDAYAWLAAGRRFRGLITWPQEWNALYRPGDFVAAFNRLAQLDEPLAYPVIHLRLDG